MNSRRLTYTLSGVISDDTISVARWINIEVTSTLGSELDGDIHANLHRSAVFHCGTESPFFQRIDGDFIELPIERADDSNHTWHAIFGNDDIQHDRAFGFC